MDNRLKLHQLLLSIGGPNVYYQPPPNFVMKYPSISYSVNNIENTHANDTVYNQNKSYLITVMTNTIDDTIIDKISKLPLCSYDRSFINDGIYHTIFVMYY